MARPKHDPNAEPTADRILGAAEQAFASAGYADVRLEDVARSAGIRRPSLLYHFGSKEKLYTAVVKRTFSRLSAALTEAMAGGADFPDQLDALVGGYVAFLEDNASFAPLLLRELLDGRGPGRELIEAELVPILDRTEAFLTAAGAAPIPWRQAILLIAMSPLVRAASGPLREPLWGAGDEHQALARRLVFGTS